MRTNLTSFEGEVCCFCGLPISTREDACKNDRGVWHHYDHTLKDTDPELYKATCRAKNGYTVPCHHKCHVSHHQTGSKHPHTEETKRHLSECLRGREVSEETRIKMGSWQKGRKLSKETCQKISDGKKGKPGNWTGRKHSEESKAKMRAAKALKRLQKEER